MNRHPRLDGAACLAALALSLAGAEADPLLTGVAYVSGAATYAMFDEGGAGGPGHFTSSLSPGMALPDSTRVDVAKDGKVMLSPVPAIRYVLYPGTHAVNGSFGFRMTAAGNQAFAYRLRLLVGTVVGDVVGPLHGIDNRIATPRGDVSVDDGHFLIIALPDGSTKYAVSRGALAVSVPGDKDYRVETNQVLTLLSDSARRASLAGATPAQTPEQQVLAQVSGSGVILGTLAEDSEAAELLAEAMPVPNGDIFTTLLGMPKPDTLPGQEPLGYNPENLVQQLPNPANTSSNPDVSPIFP